MTTTTPWLTVTRGEAPLIVSIPHTGTGIPPEIESRLASRWLGLKDADWHVERLYGFASDLGATIVRTSMARSVIDVNRDPSGASLYPGQATTGLCPLTTFDGEALYRPGTEPDDAEVAERRDRYFTPFHAALSGEIRRLRAAHGHVVLIEAHSIRSEIPRLFDGMLPHFSIGTNTGASCADTLARHIESIVDASGFTRVTDGRFKGGWTTRNYGRPGNGVHAVQIEMAVRTYLEEPARVTPENWPARYDEEHARPARDTLRRVLDAALAFAKERP